jgi:hypothetical protein
MPQPSGCSDLRQRLPFVDVLSSQPAARAADMRGFMTRIQLSAFALIVVVVVTGCTKENKLFCCVTAEDCERLQLPPGDLRPCDEGLACVQNYCVPQSCEDSACPASAPVCDKATDTCGGCSEAADCQLFSDQPECNAATGACVECTVSAQCSAAAPVCDRDVCRKCVRDAECPSGACADDGTCVPEAGIVYLAPDGVDVQPCSRTSPCQLLGFAVSQTTAARNHIVMAQGLYDQGLASVVVMASTTSAPSLSLHGGGAKLVGGNGDGFLAMYLPVTIRDLELENPTIGDGSAISIGAKATLERVRLRANTGMFVVGAQLTMREVTIDAATRGILNNGGGITIDRAIIGRGTIGIDSRSGSLDVSNALIHDTSDVGIDLTDTTAAIKFTTIANAGLGGPSTPSLRRAGAGMVSVVSSIIWTPANPARIGVAGSMTLTTSIVGPIAVPGAMNNNPSFVDALYHLAPSSVARDLVGSGPERDFEGDPRPRGAAYDIGADETP